MRRIAKPLPGARVNDDLNAHTRAVAERLHARVEWCDCDVIHAVLELALEIAGESRDSLPIGALFTFGRPQAVLETSRPLILDPLAGHAPHARHIRESDARGTLKALAQLDGAFVLADDGTVIASCRYLDIPSAGVRMPMGLGSRHLAGASISKHLKIIAIVVSASGTVRVFCRGDLVAEFRPAVEFRESSS